MKQLGLVVALALVLVIPARADSVLWYNGDFDFSTGLVSVIDGSQGGITGTALVYDDFIVPSGGWTVDRVWSNAIFNPNFQPSSAYWEIRSGVSAGNGDTLVASGTSSATLTSQGPWIGYNLSGVEVDGLSVSLGPGTYWLGLAPVDGTFTYDAYAGTTSGANAVGSPQGNDSNSFLDWPANGWSFIAVAPTFGVGDFSMGVAGQAGGQVPEPCTLALFALGGLGLLRRRAKK